MTVVDYRCVCGETISLEVSTGGKCAHCGRHYSTDALRNAASETLSLADLSARNALPTAAANSSEEDAYLGRTLGHFQVLRRLGLGGMGCVYQALDTSLQRYVALKVIRAAGQSFADTTHLQRLFQEAIAQARVNHPNVVHIYYVGRDCDCPFLAMELVGGLTLAQRLERGRIPFSYVVETGIQLADALRACLQFDIVHGDIKPSNVLLTESGTAKLSDFGLATRLSLALPNRTGIAGTPNYLAPELAAGSAPDMRSDMYSLGVTLFEMTFGRLPFSFSSSDIQERLRAHQEARIEFPQPWPADVPQAWQHVLTRLMAKSSDDRYSSYAALLADLRRLRPVSLPVAGRLQRGLAWGVDLFCTALLQGAVAFPLMLLDSPSNLFGKLLLALVSGAVASSVPLLFAGIQSYWGKTPGKALFQIRIVDRHGLPPARTVLAARSVFQVLPIWSIALGRMMRFLGVGFVAMVIEAAAVLVTFLSAGIALVERNRRSVHDLMFDTRVVLDAGPPDEFSPL